MRHERARDGGRSLAEAHSHLAIDDHHVDLVLGHLAAVLAALGVAQALIDAAAAAVDGLRDRRVGRERALVTASFALDDPVARGQ